MTAGCDVQGGRCSLAMIEARPKDPGADSGMAQFTEGVCDGAVLPMPDPENPVCLSAL